MDAIGDGAAPYRTAEERQRVVKQRFAVDRDCWLVTHDPADGPYVIPLSFAVSGSLALMVAGSGRRTVTNLAADTRAAFVLGGYGDAIRAYGRCAVFDLRDVPRDLSSAYVAKTAWNSDPPNSSA